MKTMAIISEYNPFHNGHAYQINQHRTACGVDCVIAVMSGNFVQRGAPAICDKWTRAQMALLGGVDLVLELPTVYALGSAERFSYGAVSLIHALFGVDYLSFGSESGEIAPLWRAAEVLAQDEFQEKIAEKMKSGISYPAAKESALSDIFGKEQANLFSEPNHLLATEYLKSLIQLGSQITPITVKRSVSHYAKDSENQMASASFIRERMNAGDDISPLVPAPVSALLRRAINEGKAPACTQALDSILTYLLRTKTAKELQELPDMTEGLEYRFIDAARSQSTVEELADAVKSKRYTRTRIDRTLMHLLLGIKKSDQLLSPQYFRVLAANAKGTAFLRLQKENPLPVITKAADAKLESVEAKRMFDIDCLATDIYSMLYPEKKNNCSGLDFLQSPIIIK